MGILSKDFSLSDTTPYHAYTTNKNTMGLSRRMQKQGMPEPLNESLFSKKRKLAAAKAEHQQPPTKKNKQLNGHAKLKQATKQKVTRIQPPGKSSLKTQKEKTTPKALNGTKQSQSKKPQLLDDTLSESQDEDQFKDDFDGISSPPAASNGIDDPDILEDEFNNAATDRLEDAELDASSGSDPFDSDDALADDRNGMWSDDESAASDLNAANIEGLSKHLDAKAAEEAAQAQAELEEAALQTNIADDTLPDIDDDHARPRLAPDLQLLRTRIGDTIRILDDFSKHKTATSDTRSRSEYTAQLEKDICAYFNYTPFLANKLLSLFPPREALAFFESNETPRPVVLRTNTLRTHRRELAQSLINRGVTLEPVGKWSKVGLQVFESNVPLGATPEYLTGHYMLQAASSFLPVMALAPQENERVLDMAAAPGGKTTHAAALMHNTGVIFANDANKARAKALIGNIARLGVRNAIVSACDALTFPKTMYSGFDRVLLDAPCSGTGVIAKDPSIKTGKTEHDFIRLPEQQKKLLLAAIDSTDHASKTGGYIVYSTCSVAVDENEAVVAYALRKRPNVKVVDTALPFGREGFVRHAGKVFPDGMKLARRFYPHVYNVDGFFVCKLRKVGPTLAIHSHVASARGDKQMVGGTDAETTPVEGDGPAAPATDDDDAASDFGGFDEEEDRAMIEQHHRKAMRRRGLNPRADRRKASVQEGVLTTEVTSR